MKNSVRKSGKSKLLLITAVIFALCLLMIAPFGMSANAGMSTRVVDNASITDGINEGSWYIDGGVTGEDDAMKFSNGSSVLSRAISRTRMRDISEYGIYDCGDVDITFQIKSLGDGSKFSIVFGLKSLISEIGSAATTEIFIDATGNNLRFGVNSFDEDGVKKELKAAEAVRGIEESADIALKILAGADGDLTVILNGKASDPVFFREKCAYVTGYFGMFLSSPESGTADELTLKSVNVKSYYYDNALNPGKAVENFDNDKFNSEAWYCSSYPGFYGSGYIRPENGQLAMKNVREGYFSTYHEYSNFELTFDVTKLIREAQYDDNGNVTAPVSGWFGISFGAPSYDTPFDVSVRQTTFFQYECYQRESTLTPVTDGRYILWDNYVPLKADVSFAEGRNLWNKSDVSDANGRERAVTLKFVMSDGLFTVSEKYDDETNFTEVFQYDMGYTPSGTVRILTYGAGGVSDPPEKIQAGNIWIDNVSIENLDQKKEEYITEIGYTANFNGWPDPYEYTDTWEDSDLISSEGGHSNGPILTLAGTILAAAAVMLVTRRA